MGKASASKKVARAARTGGGRTSRGQRPWGWYLAITAVVVLGTVTIAFSRDQYQDELAAGSSLEPPYHQGSDLKPDGDHWHSAYGVYLCDAFAPPVTDRRDPKGIHTHGDGVIHVHPFVPSAAGANATLGVFADAVDMTLTDSKIGAPGGDTYDEGSTKCDGKLGRVQVRVEEGGQSRVVVVGLRDVKLNDRSLITIAFVPDGTDIPAPPSAAQLDQLSDVPASTTTTSAPGGGEGATTEAETTTTTAAATTTTVPATTTVAPTTTVSATTTTR